MRKVDKQRFFLKKGPFDVEYLCFSITVKNDFFENNRRLTFILFLFICFFLLCFVQRPIFQKKREPQKLIMPEKNKSV